MMKEENEEMTLVNFRVTKKQRKRLKALAVERDTTVTEMLTGFINKLIGKDGK